MIKDLRFFKNYNGNKRSRFTKLKVEGRIPCLRLSQTEDTFSVRGLRADVSPTSPSCQDVTASS